MPVLALNGCFGVCTVRASSVNSAQRSLPAAEKRSANRRKLWHKLMMWCLDWAGRGDDNPNVLLRLNLQGRSLQCAA